MSKKAVDVVLLPEDKIADKAIEFNAQLVENFGPRLVLNKKNCLPHISLAMGCINDSNLPAISSTLNEIVQQILPGWLEITDVEAQTNAVGETVLSLKIEKSYQLQSLHEQIMEKMLQFFDYKVSDDMLFDSQVELSTLNWIRDYREKSSFYHFSPHITLGYGEIVITAPRLKFKAKSLAVCHLGNHCTCRDILTSVAL
jgi:2'-5' RNA ligase